MNLLILPAAAAFLALLSSLISIFSAFHSRGPDGLDLILVLGARLREDGPCRTLRYRLETAAAYMKASPETVCIVSGGQGPDEPCPEAEGMALYLKDLGIDKGRILLESRSSNTRQNLLFCRDLLPPACGRIGIVTSDFHMYRSLFLARAYGLPPAYGIAAKSARLYLPANLLRESCSLLKDRLLIFLRTQKER